MGLYINQTSTGAPLPNLGKADALIADGAVVVKAQWQPNLICVVNNGMFEAAGYAFCEEEFNVFKMPDGRKKIWLTHPKAEELAK